MVHLILGGVGVFVIAAFSDLWEPAAGFFMGLLFAEVILLKRRIKKLEQHLSAPKAPPKTPPKPDRPEEPLPAAIATAPPGMAAEKDSSSDRPKLPEPQKPPGPQKAAPSGLKPLTGRVKEKIKSYFTTGNVVTKVGIIVLFFGFAFLLKYAAQNSLLPIEFRLMGVFAGGLGLLGLGWHFREKKRVYALLLQGGGIGILYLTVFAAARLYDLLPMGLSFGLMFCLVALLGALSVLQDARSMAVAGIAGGFLAPLLMSTGQGSHVMLFSYYALLNLGIFGIAWFKAWRVLNLVGFGFTFGIATLWGGNYYQPAHFAATEPFLILFFLFYVTISILFAGQTPVNLRGYVDGTLVFGTPVVVFGLQYCLVKDTAYGMAVSAVVLGIFYVFLAKGLWRIREGRFRLLAESFLAFGVVFGSLAVPLGCDGRWTAAAWALEGAAVLWVGIRQQRLVPRLFGLLLQAGAGVFFIEGTGMGAGPLPVVNAFAMGCALISFAGLFSGWYMAARAADLVSWERKFHIPLMVWGVLWWFAAGLNEIDRFVAYPDQPSALLIFCAVSFPAMGSVARRLNWPPLAYPGMLLLPVMILFSVVRLVDTGAFHLLRDLGAMAWPVAFGANYLLLAGNERIWPIKILSLWHPFSLWLGMAVITGESVHGVQYFFDASDTWVYGCCGAVPAGLAALFLRFGQRLPWPVQRFSKSYHGVGLAIPLLVLVGFALCLVFLHGDPAPLPYIPLVNPVALTQVFIFLLAAIYVGHRESLPANCHGKWRTRHFRAMLSGAGFLFLNGVVARSVHFYWDVPYTAFALFDSLVFQAAASLLWGVTALVTTLTATRKGSRPAWIAGAVILCLAVGKLFLVDLAGSSTIARIVSFLGVGSLMLLIGYFSPLPPDTPKEPS